MGDVDDERRLIGGFDVAKDFGLARPIAQSIAPLGPVHAHGADDPLPVRQCHDGVRASFLDSVSGEDPLTIHVSGVIGGPHDFTCTSLHAGSLFLADGYMLSEILVDVRWRP